MSFRVVDREPLCNEQGFDWVERTKILLIDLNFRFNSLKLKYNFILVYSIFIVYNFARIFLNPTRMMVKDQTTTLGSKFDWLNQKSGAKTINAEKIPKIKFKSKILQHHTSCMKVLLDIDKADSLNDNSTIQKQEQFKKI